MLGLRVQTDVSSAATAADAALAIDAALVIDASAAITAVVVAFAVFFLSFLYSDCNHCG